MLLFVHIFVTTGVAAIVESNFESKSVDNSTKVGCISDHMLIDDVDIKIFFHFSILRSITYLD